MNLEDRTKVGRWLDHVSAQARKVERHLAADRAADALEDHPVLAQRARAAVLAGDTVTDLTFAAVYAPLDTRLCQHDRDVMAAVGRRPAGLSGLTLDGLCDLLPNRPRPYIFAAVARLEDLGYLPKGTIR